MLYSNCLPYIYFFPEMCSQILKNVFGKFQTRGNMEELYTLYLDSPVLNTFYICFISYINV